MSEVIYHKIAMAPAVALLIVEKKAQNKWASLLFKVESLR